MDGGCEGGKDGRRRKKKGRGGRECLHLNPHSTLAVLEQEGLEEKMKRKRERSGARVGNECSTNADSVC